MSITPPSMLDAALLYAEMGYPVFPCAPGSKRPLTRHGFQDATTDDEQIERWWSAHPTANIAIPTQGMVVIDIDGEQNPWLVDEPERLIDLAVAPQSRTGNGGRQCIFRQPAGRHYRNTTGSLAPHVDTRADGGYIVVAPSVLAGGKQYTWVPGVGLDVGLELLPEPPTWLVAMLDALATGDPVGAAAFQGDCGANAIPSGQRNATLARLAGAMRRVGMGQAEIAAALHATNATRCDPPLPAQEVERIAVSIARYEPDTVATALVENHYEQDRSHPRNSKGSDDTLPGGDDPGNPGAFPEYLLQVPGFVSELAEHTLRTAPYPQSILAFAGALSAQAFLAGRRARDASDSRTNLYVLALANSGAGKDHPRKINQRVPLTCKAASATSSPVATASRTDSSPSHRCCFRSTRSMD